MDSLLVEMELQHWMDARLWLDAHPTRIDRTVGRDFVKWRRNRQLKDINWLHSIMKAWHDAALRNL